MYLLNLDHFILRWKKAKAQKKNARVRIPIEELPRVPTPPEGSGIDPDDYHLLAIDAKEFGGWTGGKEGGGG